MKLIPTAGWVLIEELPEEEKTSVGVYLPETSKDKSVKGKVLVVGNNISDCNDCVKGLNVGHPLKKAPCEVGNIVIFKKWATNEVNDNGKKYVLVEFKDIIAYYGN